MLLWCFTLHSSLMRSAQVPNKILFVDNFAKLNTMLSCIPGPDAVVTKRNLWVTTVGNWLRNIGSMHAIVPFQVRQRNLPWRSQTTFCPWNIGRHGHWLLSKLLTPQWMHLHSFRLRPQLDPCCKNGKNCSPKFQTTTKNSHLTKHETLLKD